MSDRQASRIYLKDEHATVGFGEQIANALRSLAAPGAGICDFTIYLSGTLGAGKTTFTRGLLVGFGHSAAVKSPTYTLVEPYQLEEQKIYHFDLYRLADPEELEYLGIRDYFSESALRIIEWPQKAEGYLPEPDLKVDLDLDVPGRSANVQTGSAQGSAVLSNLDL